MPYRIHLSELRQVSRCDDRHCQVVHQDQAVVAVGDHRVHGDVVEYIGNLLDRLQ